jgi:2-phospho-L-lactate guanylyltransferase
MTQPGRWCLVVPVKRLARAKTRLGLIAGPHRVDLALAFALDTVEAALACELVLTVVTVTDEPVAARHLGEMGATVVADAPDAGLNPALVHGALVARRAHRDCGVGALSADLPAVRSAELALALRQAADYEVSFVRDAAGAGTTLLLAGPAGRFEPRFGADSATLHASAGAVELTGALESVRRDVDTEQDLAAAVVLGLGPRSAAVVARLATQEPR